MPRHCPSPSQRPSVNRPPEWKVSPKLPLPRMVVVLPCPGMPKNCGALVVTRGGSVVPRVHHSSIRACVPPVATPDATDGSYAHGVAKERRFEAGWRDVSTTRRHDGRHEPPPGDTSTEPSELRCSWTLGAAGGKSRRGNRGIASDDRGHRKTRNDRARHRRSVNDAAVRGKFVRSRRNWSRRGRGALQARPQPDRGDALVGHARTRHGAASGTAVGTPRRAARTGCWLERVSWAAAEFAKRPKLRPSPLKNMRRIDVVLLTLRSRPASAASCVRCLSLRPLRPHLPCRGLRIPPFLLVAPFSTPRPTSQPQSPNCRAGSPGAFATARPA